MEGDQVFLCKQPFFFLSDDPPGNDEISEDVLASSLVTCSTAHSQLQIQGPSHNGPPLE